MPRDGSGVYSLPANSLQSAGETIDPNEHNTTLNDIATELTGSLPINGSKGMSSDLPMGSNKITALAAGSAASDAVNMGQVFGSVDEKTADYTIQATDRGKIIAFDANAAARTATLPAAATIGEGFYVAIKKTGGGNNPVTIDANASETIDGAATKIIRDDDGCVTVRSDGAGWQIQSEHSPSSTPPGAILAYGGASSPAGWLLCDGSEYSETIYASLFAVCGTTYNTGGETTGFFRVPDMRGRVPAGKEASATRLTSGGGGVDGGTLGATGGAETHTLTEAEMPAHDHTVNDPGHSHTVQYQHNAISSGADGNRVTTINAGQPLSGSTVSATTGITVESAGGDGAHANVQPTIVLNYIIKI